MVHAPHSSELADVKFIAITHSHRDHMSVPSRQMIGNGRIVLVPENTAQHIRKVKDKAIVEMGYGQAIWHNDIEIIALPAHHPSARHLVGRKTRTNSYLVRSRSGYLFLQRQRIFIALQKHRRCIRY